MCKQFKTVRIDKNEYIQKWEIMKTLAQKQNVWIILHL